MKSKKEINFYDLTNKDLSVYAREYFKTPGGKRVTLISGAYAIFLILMLIDVLFSMINNAWLNNTSNVYELVIVILVFLALFTLVEVYHYLNFYNYLKKKYNISRW